MLRIALTSPCALASWAVCTRLLRRGESVRILSRNIARVTPLMERGAQVVHGDLRDPNALAELLRDSSVVIVVTPSAGDRHDTYELEVADTLVNAFRASRVEHIIYVSALGADDPGNVPHLQSKAEVENRLATLGQPLTILRPAVMMEFLCLAFRALDRGVLALPLSSNRSFPAIAAEDVAQAAVYAIHHRPEGCIAHDLTGPAPLTPRQIATTLEHQWGRPMEFTPLSPAAYAEHLQALGVSERRALITSRLLADYERHDCERGKCNQWRQIVAELGIQETRIAPFAAQLQQETHLPGMARERRAAHTFEALRRDRPSRSPRAEGAVSEIWIA